MHCVRKMNSSLILLGDLCNTKVQLVNSGITTLEKVVFEPILEKLAPVTCEGRLNVTG
jgi:hypothetical protein